MKKEIFNTYVNRVCRIMNIDKEVIFSRSKKRECTEARQILYWVCNERPIQQVSIVKYMNDNGYNAKGSEVNYGVSVVNKNISEDADYSIIINKII